MIPLPFLPLLIGDFLVEHYLLLGIVFWMLVAVLVLLIFDIILHLLKWENMET